MPDDAPLTPATDRLPPGAFRLSTAVFVERGNEILLLKRAAGAMTGGWYLPGGAVDPGETVEEGARRELMEEAGLAADGALTCVAVAHMRVYGADALQILYACESAAGDVVISHEHSASRWMDPTAYRDRYFGDDILARFAGHRREREMLLNIRDAIDAYLRWRAMRDAANTHAEFPNRW